MEDIDEFFFFANEYKNPIDHGHHVHPMFILQFFKVTFETDHIEYNDFGEYQLKLLLFSDFIKL